MLLFVVCGCLFISMRSQHDVKYAEIDRLRKEQATVRLAIQKIDTNIKRHLAPGILEDRLRTYQSTLQPVGVEQTETLVPDMTAAR